MSMRTRGTSTRAPPPLPATPRHDATRRAASCGNEPSRCLNFCHALRVYERSLGSWKVFAVVDIEYERCTLRLLSVRFISLVPFSSRRSLSPPSLAPIKGRSLLSERRTRTSSSRHRFLYLSCCSLPHPGLRRAPRVVTVGLRNRTTLSPVREKGDKVFGERSARLLTSSSRTPTTTSPTTTSSPMSTTSSTTWLERMSTPSPVLLLLLSRTCSCSFC